MAGRDSLGKFVPKSDGERAVRSIRATERVWHDFGELAKGQDCTRADLLERWVEHMPPAGAAGELSGAATVTPIQLAIAVQVLNEALTLRANRGGAIKDKIRAALAELEGVTDDKETMGQHHRRRPGPGGES